MIYMTKDTQQKKPPTTAHQVLEVLKKYIKTQDDILIDYVAESGITTELEAANEWLLSDIGEILDKADSFDAILEKLKAMDAGGIDAGDLLDLIELDADDIADRAHDLGYVCVKVNNMLDRNKLEDFITREIYPSYNEQRANVMM